MINRSDLVVAFQERYGELPETIVRAPLPVALLGEQVAGREGLTLSLATDRSYYIAASHRVDKLVRTTLRPTLVDDRFSLEEIELSTTRPWSNYIRGVCKAVQARDLPLFGANLLLDYDPPLNNNMGSTAALTVGLGYTLQLLNGFSLLGEELALLAMGAEQSFVGAQSTIADHLVSALGEAGKALLIDCLDMSYQPLALPDQLRIVLCQVAATPDAEQVLARRAEYNEAITWLRTVTGEPLATIRDMELAELARHAAIAPSVALERVYHAVSEQQRVRAAAEALAAGDLARCGELLYESHESLRDAYQLSMPELDLLVELAHRQPGCYGARMQGDGGSVLNLVQASSVDTFVRSIAAAYERETGSETTITVCRPANGVSRAGSS
jgi:galactokinase